MRLESGYPSVVRYLINQGYLKYLSEEELKTIIENPKFIRNLSKCTRDTYGIPQWLLNMINDCKNAKTNFNILKRDHHDFPILRS